MTSRALLNPQDANYLAKLLGMLGSDHAGEVANAGRKANAFIRRLGLSWSDVLYCPPDSWLQMAADCRRHEGLLNERERDFLHNLSRLRRPPSDKQLAWLENIYARLHERERAA
jgi:hypothetical protein